MNYKNLVSILSLASASTALAHSEPAVVAFLSNGEPLKLSPVVVTAGPGDKPLETTIDARAPAQPIPAQDGADYLKSVPGFSVIRKGGIDGDPILRGQAGSRLNVLLDGQNIFGGCGNRMDPPTAYVFPAAYDRITVLKGPQTVLYGPGNSAGVVLFERDAKRFEQPGAAFDGSATFGGFGREEGAAEVRTGVPTFYLQGAGTFSKQDDYEDGNGDPVHSAYRRWSANVATGWAPDKDTLAELSAARSDGEAAYADRMMDGASFERENIGLRFKKQNVSKAVEKIEAQAYYNYVDHVMDNYSLRTFVPSMMMPGRAASNPDRKTVGGRFSTGLKFAEGNLTTLGVDFQSNRHTVRGTSNEPFDPYEAKARVCDAVFNDYGLFGEIAQSFTENGRIVIGARVDRWTAEDSRATASAGMATVANPTAKKLRERKLGGGFIRVEKSLKQIPVTAYVGLGHTERFPDYWELFSKESAGSVSAFETKPEKTTQVDVGAIYRKAAWAGSVSLFSNKVTDFILIESGYLKPSGMMGTRRATITRNIEASAWGGEASLSWYSGHWKVDGSIAYVRGTNHTDGLPLAQQPPLEGRIGLAYATKSWSLGALTRVVAEQDRYALNQGNIVGQDLGPADEFNVFSLNASWRIVKFAQLAAGVDNVFNRAYAEFVSRSGGDVSGYLLTTRVNEPGRTLWAKLTVTF